MYLCIVCIRISCFWPSKNTHIKNLCKIQRCHTAALAIPHYFSTSDVKPAWSKLGCFLPTGQRQGRHAVGDPHGDEKQRPSDLATFGGEDDAGRDRTAEWHGRPGWLTGGRPLGRQSSLAVPDRSCLGKGVTCQQSFCTKIGKRTLHGPCTTPS